MFVSTATRHDGQETTITSFHSTLLSHHRMVLLGLPYAWAGQARMDEVTSGLLPGWTTA